MTTPPTSVDDDIAAQPEALQETLHELRRCILAAAPDAGESIRYGMPAYRLPNGHPVYFAGWARHVSLHDIPSFEGDLEAAVQPYRSGKDTLRFPNRHPVPFALVGAVVAAVAGRPEGTGT
jgi:uncharacterized protein YdhG (YjbR/CyaY superfamily)